MIEVDLRLDKDVSELERRIRDVPFVSGESNDRELKLIY
jgi:hypothetical protein